MNRAWITGGIVGALALLAMVLVVMALRPPTVERVSVAPFEIGAVDASGKLQWRWVGPENCNADADVVQLERNPGDGTWTKVPIPLANVRGISFADEQNGIAVGTTKQCARGVSLTENGGRTWKSNPNNPVLLDAWYDGSIVWGVERVIGTPQVSAFQVDSRLRLRPVRGFTPVRPCAASDGVPDDIAFWNSDDGVLLCQNTVIDARLLAATANGGGAWEARLDDRAAGGLDGVEPVLNLDVAGEESVWVQFAASGDCSEGQLRYSGSAGSQFDRLPCPSKSVDTPIDEILDVAFTSQQNGVMLALRDRTPVMLSTSDGGSTWSE